MLKRFVIRSRQHQTVAVQAENWIIALGLGLERIGVSADLEQIACEVLGNGQVIVRDSRTGTGFVIDEQKSPISAELNQVDDPPSPFRLLIARAENVDQASEIALHAIQEQVACESGAVLIKAGRNLRFTATSGPRSAELQGLEMPAAVGVAGFALQSRRAIVLGNASSDSRHFSGFDMVIGYETRSIVAVPIIFGAHIFGVLELMNASDAESFSEDETDKVGAIALALGEWFAGRLPRKKAAESVVMLHMGEA